MSYISPTSSLNLYQTALMKFNLSEKFYIKNFFLTKTSILLPRRNLVEC